MLDINIRNLKVVFDELIAAETQLENLEEFYRGPALRSLKRMFNEIFRGEGAIGKFPRWAPLAPSTLRKKQPRQGILHVTGRLRGSYSRTPHVNINRNTMRIGSVVPYAKYHERGTARMPARTVLARAEVIGRLRLQRALNKYLREELDGNP